MNLKQITGSKTDSSDNPERIILEGLEWITRSSDNPILQILLTTEEVLNLLGVKIKEHAIDGEVPPHCILFCARGHLHVWLSASLGVNLSSQPSNVDRETVYVNHGGLDMLSLWRISLLQNPLEPSIQKNLAENMCIDIDRDVNIIALSTH